jgi:hypothetical protein
MTPQLVTLNALPDYGWHRAYTTAPEAKQRAEETGQVAYYYLPTNKTYYVPERKETENE